MYLSPVSKVIGYVSIGLICLVMALAYIGCQAVDELTDAIGELDTTCKCNILYQTPNEGMLDVQFPIDLQYKNYTDEAAEHQCDSTLKVFVETTGYEIYLSNIICD